MKDAEWVAAIERWLERGIVDIRLANHSLDSLPESIGKLTQAKWLELDMNALRSLPDSIGNLSQLWSLSLTFNRLERLPESIGKLTQLKLLDLFANDLQTLPESIGDLTQLKTLILDHNHLQTLPESIGSLTRLEQLFLDDNRLRSLPEGISNLTQLRRLVLSNNPQLLCLPQGLKLTQLNVSGCTRLSSLPDDLIVTEWLDLADTAITSLPSTLHLLELRWHGVPITERIAFHPETITHYEVFAETNAERRRVLIERMGYERFLREAQPEIIDTDHDPGGERVLLQIALQDDEPLVCLSVIDPSTGRKYLLRVPPRARTCHQAAAWIAGFDDPEDYKPLVET